MRLILEILRYLYGFISFVTRIAGYLRLLLPCIYTQMPVFV